MKELIYNNENLNLKEITEKVVRVKALIKNSNNELLLGFSHTFYQFPGGHLEPNETIIDCVKREVQEETGIVLDIDDEIKPFFKISYYNKNYKGNMGVNRLNEIYYVAVYTNDSIDLNNTNYTEDEILGNYKLTYINLNDVENVLIQSITPDNLNKTIVSEMLEAIKVYKEEFL